MGLDQRLTWMGKISEDEKVLLQGREAYPRNNERQNGYEISLGDFGIAEIDKNDFDIKQHKYIESLLTPVKMLVWETDWNRIKKECNVSKSATLWGLGPYYVKFGETMETCKEYKINLYAGKYDILVERILYLYRSIDLYEWRNNYDIQELFNSKYPDVYDEYDKKYEIVYNGFYPIEELFEEMKRIDSKFAERYCGIIQNVFYSADW